MVETVREVASEEEMREAIPLCSGLRFESALSQRRLSVHEAKSGITLLHETLFHGEGKGS